MGTRKAYFKNDKEVVRPLSLVYNGCTFVPPTDEIIIASGYEIRQVEISEHVSYIPTYEERVVQLIREKYTIDDELGILRQKDSKPDEFVEYNEYCEKCKIQAKEEV